MMLIEETSIPDGALPVDAFKAHLRLGTGFSDGALQDAVLASFLRAAMAAIEARTGKILLEREFSWTLTAWRDCAAQSLPIAPVTAVTQVLLRDADGAVSTADAGEYRLIMDQQRPVLAARGTSLPGIPEGGEVAVWFRAGFAIAFDDLPSDLALAVFLLAAHYYEHRSEVSMSGGDMPYGVSVLIERYKVVRLVAGARS
ncbi:MAG: head-tail connector protein [Pseudomonadota bacterium]